MEIKPNRRVSVEIVAALVAVSVPAAFALAQIQEPPKNTKTQDNTTASRPAPSSMPAVFQPTDGWVWIMAPRKIEPGISHLLVLSREGNEEVSESWLPMASFAMALVPRKEGMTYEVAAFDAHHTRIELPCNYVDDGFAKCVVSRIQDTGTVYVGIEALTAEAQQKIASLAFEKAKKKGLSPLPYVGDPDVPETWPKGVYDFELNIEGTLTRSSFPGKIIIIDCWATWCTPCMAKMPELVKLSRKHKEHLSVISISYDDDAKKARMILKSLGVQWPLFILPRDKEDRALWLTSFRGKNDAAVPIIIVIDQKGRMRHVYPFEVKSTVEELLKPASRPAYGP